MRIPGGPKKRPEFKRLLLRIQATDVSDFCIVLYLVHYLSIV